MKGKLIAPGICPDRMPALGSGSVPLKRPEERASMICPVAPLIIFLMPSRFLTRVGFRLHLNDDGEAMTGEEETLFPALIHLGRPPSKTATLS